MKILTTITGTKTEILAQRANGHSIGFVPTMGALHEGHLSLLRKSVSENNFSVCSIFVNPIQFNNKQDLEKYPRTLEEDCAKLEAAGCDLVFAPSVAEMYPDEVSETYDFGQLEHLMEGMYRPGHFNGVAVVVKRLFDICLPHHAYFGEKDFQQLMIIKELVKKEKMDVAVIGCPIVREDDGLAMSSRNVRLSEEERLIAPKIFEALRWVRQQSGKESPEQVLEIAVQRLNKLPGMAVEYLQLADELSLLPVKSWDQVQNVRAFIAVFLGEIRLIDNLKIH